MNDSEFQIVFKYLTGRVPLRWQERLFREHFANNDIRRVIDLPTGLGKTMVMALWLIAFMEQLTKGPPKLPRRLVYVVDRRTVVDQATKQAVRFQKRIRAFHRLSRRRPDLAHLCESLPIPAISTLRGQLADNREWSRDPSRPAIIIGTVDLIGSALLFSGYRSSYKTRPLHAGLLGQDSLLVLDEAHLSKPFEKLVTSIVRFQQGQRTSVKVIRMSATSGKAVDEKPPFTLIQSDLDDVVIKERFESPKRLTIEPPVEKSQLNAKLADAAIALAKNGSIKGKRIVVFVRSPEDAKTIADLIRDNEIKSEDNSGKKPKTIKSMPFADFVEVLTGTMRGLERDELIEKPILKRFLNGEIVPADPANQHPVFLISTSAGEVGFDLNADHMVCDAAPLDSMIQRLGRVNRRGLGDAIIRLIREKDPAGDTDIKKACVAASELFVYEIIRRAAVSYAYGCSIATNSFVNEMDVSPKSLAEFKSKLLADQLKSASTPEPTMVELTDILLDAWSMTSITIPMPGRPEVAPWLRGIAHELPQTTIAWRVELDLHGFDQLDIETIEEWFDTHGIRTHEVLSVPTSAAGKWFIDRWDRLSDAQKSEVGARSIIVDRAGLKLVTVKNVIDELGRKNTDSIRNADLILPASFGGIERHKGLLDADAPQVPKDEDTKSPEERQQVIVARRVAPDVADQRGRYRELITKTEDGEPETRPIGSGSKPVKSSRLVVELESDDGKRVRLVSFVPKQEKPEWGSKRQSLCEHVQLVRKKLDEILARFDVPDVVKVAAQLAADYHDHGKNRERWQRAVDGVPTPPGEKWRDETLGKSGGEMKRDPRGYRHEFGSLREFIDAHRDAKFTDSNGKDITQQVIDLALHLIATHHGRGRPHFPKGGFDPNAEPRSPEIHTESIRRFARLQRQYGHWRLAWLENLLRCADALASAEIETADDADETTGGAE